MKMPMTVHRLHENRNQHLQTLAADAVRSLPQHDQRFAHRVVIKPRTLRRWSTPQQTHGMLAVKAAHRRQFIKNARLLCPIASGAALRYLFHQLISHHHAYPPHLICSRSKTAGSKSDEATTQHPGAV
ncbi:hypothetical protein MES4922_10305 [Mesorhizobium ventifaucium]|uniref:Uncharacterized protein n=1 Tax=Mesorhizobium ventifaucium TaxID=666020 RepID=A0ABN8J8B7_9HYPH|nr:hypothetical protein MES4922_10305 [Mesorhizobium ventifaucium]